MKRLCDFTGGASHSKSPPGQVWLQQVFTVIRFNVFNLPCYLEHNHLFKWLCEPLTLSQHLSYCGGWR